MNVKLHNKRVAEKTVELNGLYPSGYLFVTSRTDSTAVTEVSCALGAKNLIEDSHTISSPEEIAEYQRHAAAVREQLQRTELARNKPSLAISTGRDGDSQ
jgi:hypothetical protein